MYIITPAELLKRYAAGERNFAGITLRDRPVGDRNGTSVEIFRGADLRNIILSGAYMPDVSFINANLSGAEMIGAYLPRADLSSIDLSSADLTGANLRMAVLEVADLRGTKLIAANLTYANLSGADLTHAVLEEANLSFVRLSSIEGRSCTMHSLCAVNAFIWNTTLPDGEFIEGPLFYTDL